jgi:hypothetical protein
LYTKHLKVALSHFKNISHRRNEFLNKHIALILLNILMALPPNFNGYMLNAERNVSDFDQTEVEMVNP